MGQYGAGRVDLQMDLGWGLGIDRRATGRAHNRRCSGGVGPRQPESLLSLYVHGKRTTTHLVIVGHGGHSLHTAKLPFECREAVRLSSYVSISGYPPVPLVRSAS